MIRLDGLLRQELIDFLTQIYVLQSEYGRHSVIKNAGLETLLPRMKLSDPTATAVGNIVDFLAQWGTIEGREALFLFLFALLNEVGEDGQKVLHSFIDELSGRRKSLLGAEVQALASETMSERSVEGSRVVPIAGIGIWTELEKIREQLVCYREVFQDSALLIQADSLLQTRVVSGLETLLKQMEDLQVKSEGALPERTFGLLNRTANGVRLCATAAKHPPKDGSARARIYQNVLVCLRCIDRILEIGRTTAITSAETENAATRMIDADPNHCR